MLKEREKLQYYFWKNELSFKKKQKKWKNELSLKIAK